MLPMAKKEYENWKETRKQGAKTYAAKTSLQATIAVFLLYFLVNAFIKLEDIDKYIAYNTSPDQLIRLAITLLITFGVLFIVSKVIFNISEKRFKKTEETEK